jgi:N-acetylneuraminate lyase
MHDATALKGLWPAMFTPVNDDGTVNLAEMEKLIELIIAQRLNGIYLLGSTGQGFLYSEAERKQIAEATLSIVRKRIPVMVHVGALSTDESVRLARHAEAHGADAVSSVGPIYYAASPAMGLAHYKAIASAVSIPFFPYQIGNAPMTEDMIRELLQIPNLKGLKLTTLNMLDIAAIRISSGGKWTLFSGADELMCHAALCDISGAIGSTYNMFGPVCKHVRESFLKGDTELALSFMLEFQRLILEILPCIWTFFRRGMQLRYGIDIGKAKAPLLTPDLDWSDEYLMERIRRIESFLPA